MVSNCSGHGPSGLRLVIAIIAGMFSADASAQRATVAPLKPPIEWRPIDHINDAEKAFAISPNGMFLASVGDDAGDDPLFLWDVEKGNKQRLISRSETTVNVFSSPAFSPDNKHLAFALSGGSAYYPSNIYISSLEDPSLQPVTNARRIDDAARHWTGAPYYSEYFDSPQFSPDGTSIAFVMVDQIRNTVNVVVTSVRDSQSSHVAVRGKLISWSSDGKWIYYTDADSLWRLNARDKSKEIVPEIRGQILGKQLDRDVFEVYDNGMLMSIEVQPGGISKVPSLFRYMVEGLTLHKVQWSRAGLVLLVYRNEDSECADVVQISPRVQ